MAPAGSAALLRRLVIGSVGVESFFVSHIFFPPDVGRVMIVQTDLPVFPGHALDVPAANLPVDEGDAEKDEDKANPIEKLNQNIDALVSKCERFKKENAELKAKLASYEGGGD
jgi:hypothetical protein